MACGSESVRKRNFIGEVRDCLDETMKIVISNYKRTEIPETFLPYEAWIAEKIG